MTLGEKIAGLRKENNYTQEQLADLLGVSRQSVSKWESDVVYPETEKLVRMGDLFHCSMDYLLKEECTDPSGQTAQRRSLSFGEIREALCRERKSERTVWGMPLYHVGRNAHGFFAVGLRARGVISVGLFARGIVSAGLLSIGLLSFGVLSLGLISLGALSVALLAVGSVAVGMFAVGAISLGVVSVGSLAIGEFSLGALAIGKYLAVGDHARAMIAVGTREAVGDVYQHVGALRSADVFKIRSLLDANVPPYLSWAKAIARIVIQ